MVIQITNCLQSSAVCWCFTLIRHCLRSESRSLCRRHSRAIKRIIYSAAIQRPVLSTLSAHTSATKDFRARSRPLAASRRVMQSPLGIILAVTAVRHAAPLINIASVILRFSPGLRWMIAGNTSSPCAVWWWCALQAKRFPRERLGRHCCTRAKSIAPWGESSNNARSSEHRSSCYFTIAIREKTLYYIVVGLHGSDGSSVFWRGQFQSVLTVSMSCSVSVNYSHSS